MPSAIPIAIVLAPKPADFPLPFRDLRLAFTAFPFLARFVDVLTDDFRVAMDTPLNFGIC